MWEGGGEQEGRRVKARRSRNSDVTLRLLNTQAVVCTIFEDYFDWRGCTSECAQVIAAICPDLSRFSVKDTLVDFETVAFVAKTCALRFLDVSNMSSVTDETIERLVEPCGQTLFVLDVSRTRIGDAALAVIAKACPKLSSISFSWCRVTDTGMACLETCSALKSVRIDWVKDVSQAALDRLLARCTMLAEVYCFSTRIRSLPALDRTCILCK